MAENELFDFLCRIDSVLEPAKFLILLLDRLGLVYTANLG